VTNECKRANRDSSFARRLFDCLARLTAMLPLFAGCWTSSDKEVVVYAALDREFSAPILDEFEQARGIDVLAKFDVESTKTVGLANAIIGESNRPRCDLFWNNEILHTLRLEKQGLLDVYHAPAAKEFPAAYRSPTGHWCGFAARARVLIVNTEVLPNRNEWPTSITDLADEKWKGQCAIAKPLFGTTATHAAVLFSTWGDEKAKQFFRGINRTARVLSGNKQVAIDVARGKFAFGITDTDDAIIEQDKGFPVAIVAPDQGPNGIGSLFIPNTLCLIKGSPNAEHARELVDYLLRPEVEASLARGSSAQFPVNPRVDARSRVALPADVKWMQVDFAAAADAWDSASSFLLDEFQGSN
jgi:iron(III) transport system substrate-binding protein